MKVLIDMNRSPRWAERLKNVGIDAVHWGSIGKPDAADGEIMAFAAVNNYIVLTHDLDLSAILAATYSNRPSVVQIRARNTRPDAIEPQVVAALRQMEAELLAGAVLTIDSDRARLRLLPFPKRS